MDLPLDPGDEIVLHARVENVGPLPTLAAVFSDTLPVVVRLDAASVRAEAGIVEFPVGLNGLKWTVDLPPSTAREIQYGAVVHSGTLQGTRMRFSSHLDTNEGIRRSRSFGARVPVYFEDGFLYLADFDADPMASF